MLLCFASIINTLIKNIDWPIRVTISLCFMGAAVLCLLFTLRLHDESHPVNYGFLFLTFFCVFVSIAYVTL